MGQIVDKGGKMKKIAEFIRDGIKLEIISEEERKEIALKGADARFAIQ